MLQEMLPYFLKGIFIRLINMSITATMMIWLVLAMRLLLRKAPKIFSYALWAVVLFRLLCPFSFSSPVSVLNLIGASANQNGEMRYILPDELSETGAQTATGQKAGQGVEAWLIGNGPNNGKKRKPRLMTLHRAAVRSQRLYLRRKGRMKGNRNRQSRVKVSRIKISQTK